MSSGQTPFVTMAAALHQQQQQQQQQQNSNDPNAISNQLMNFAKGMNVQPKGSMMNVPGTAASADAGNMNMMPPHLLNMFGGLNPAALLAAQAAQYGLQFAPSPASTMSNSATPVPLTGDPAYSMSRPSSTSPQHYADMGISSHQQSVGRPPNSLNMSQQQAQSNQGYRYQSSGQQRQNQPRNNRRDHSSMSGNSGNRNSNRNNDEDRMNKRARSDNSGYNSHRSVQNGAGDSYYGHNNGNPTSNDYNANNSNANNTNNQVLNIAEEFNYALHELSSVTIGTTELANWFPKLIIAQDCTKVERSFIKSMAPSYCANKPAPWILPIELPVGDRPVIEIVPYAPDGISIPSARPSRYTGLHHLPMRFNSKVLIASLDPEVAKFTNTSVRDTLLSSHLRFLVNTKLENNSHQLLGGAWNAERDGANPLEDGGKPLIRTAIRCVMEQTGLDLSCVTSWVKFASFEYHRPAEIFKGKAFDEELETTIVWLVNVQEAYNRPTFEAMWRRYEVSRLKMQMTIPTGQHFSQMISNSRTVPTTIMTTETAGYAPPVLQSSRDEGEPAVHSDTYTSEESVGVDMQNIPQETYLMACSMQADKMQLRPMSLEALLEYHLNNKSEKAFELSLCAELFRDCLCLRHGMSLVHQFLAEMHSEPRELFPSFSVNGIRNQICSFGATNDDLIASTLSFNEPTFSFDVPQSFSAMMTPAVTPTIPTAAASGTDNNANPKFDISRLLANLNSNAKKFKPEDEVLNSDTMEQDTSSVSPPASKQIATPVSNPSPSSRMNSTASTRESSPEYHLPEPQNLISLAKFYQAFRYFDRNRHRFLRLGDLENLLGSLNLNFSRKVVFDLLRTKSLRKMNRTYFEETLNDASNIYNSHKNAATAGPDLNSMGNPRQRYIGKRDDVKLWYEDAISKALVP